MDSVGSASKGDPAAEGSTMMASKALPSPATRTTHREIVCWRHSHFRGSKNVNWRNALRKHAPFIVQSAGTKCLTTTEHSNTSGTSLTLCTWGANKLLYIETPPKHQPESLASSHVLMMISFHASHRVASLIPCSPSRGGITDLVRYFPLCRRYRALDCLRVWRVKVLQPTRVARQCCRKCV